MRRLRLRRTLPRVVRRSWRSSRSSIIGAGSPIDAPQECGLRLLPSYTCEWRETTTCSSKRTQTSAAVSTNMVDEPALMRLRGSMSGRPTLRGQRRIASQPASLLDLRSQSCAQNTL